MKDSDSKPTSSLAAALSRAQHPRAQQRVLHQLRNMQPRPIKPTKSEAWELGHPISNDDQLALAKAMLRRLRKAAKQLSTPEAELENRKCQALCRQLIQDYEEK